MPWDEIYTESCRGQSLDELCLQWVPSSRDKLGSRISHFSSSWRPNARADLPHPFSQHWLDFMAHVHIARRPSWSLGSNSIRWVKNGASTPLAELCWTCLSWKSLFAYFYHSYWNTIDSRLRRDMQVPSSYKQICLVNLDCLPVAELSKIIYIYIYIFTFVVLCSRIWGAPAPKISDTQHLGLK